MKIRTLLSVLAAGAVCASMLTVPTFADGEDFVITPDDMGGLTKVSKPEVEVKFASDSYGGFVLNEDNGAWLVGGDNDDTGITIDKLKEYQYFEIDFTCDNVINGVRIGPAFKIHVDENSRMTDAAKPEFIFADYLPATWVPYGSGAYNNQPIMAINSLENIYQTDIAESGTISIPVSKLLEFFPEDADYIMGIGFGANNNDFIPEDTADAVDGEEYTLTCTAIRFTNTQSAAACPNLNEAVAEPEETTAAEVTTAEKTTTAEEITTAAETTTAAATTASANTTTAAPAEANTNNNTMTLFIIIGIAVVVIVAAVIIIMAVGRKKK